jgi:hypothetical protein
MAVFLFVPSFEAGQPNGYPKMGGYARMSFEQAAYAAQNSQSSYGQIAEE